MSRWYFKERVNASRIVIVLVMIVPLFSTIIYASPHVNRNALIFQLLFVLTLLPEAVKEFLALVRDRVLLKIAALIMLFVLGGWVYLKIPFMSIDRTWFYAVQPPFIFSAIAFFRFYGTKGLKEIFDLKLMLVLLALWVILIFLVTLDSEVPPDVIGASPPIYRHIRHLNYDLAIVTMLAVCFLSDVFKQNKNRLLNSLIFFLLGFASVWSGGRGELLALSCFVLVLLVFGVFTFRSKELWFPVGVFVAGGVAVFVSGQTYLIDVAIDRTIDTQSIDDLSTGRLDLWKSSMDFVNRSWLFGYGPDAFHRLSIVDAPAVHPHNVIMQWLLEFGVVGVAGLSLMMFSLVSMCVKALNSFLGIAAPAIVAAALLSILVFSLVDGLFYHAIPLVMIDLLIAFLVSRLMVNSRG